MVTTFFSRIELASLYLQGETKSYRKQEKKKQ